MKCNNSFWSLFLISLFIVIMVFAVILPFFIPENERYTTEPESRNNFSTIINIIIFVLIIFVIFWIFGVKKIKKDGLEGNNMDDKRQEKK